MEITSSDPCDRLIYANATITSYVHSILGDRCAPKSAAIPSVAMYSILLILGLFGNACTIIVIMKNKSMHTPTNFYLMSLATSDVLMLLLGLPMELYDAINVIYPYPFSEDICKLRAFLTEFTSYASVLTILCFSVERWLAICFPLKSKSFSSFGRAGMIIFCVWMISFIAALPMAFLVVLNRVPLPDFAMNQPWTYLVTDDGLTIRGTDLCGMDFLKQAEQNIIIYFAFIVFFLLPALLITSAYCHIFIRLKNIDSCFGKSVRLVQVTDKQERTRRSVLKVLVAVVVSFFLCWFPFHLQRLLSINMTESNSSPAMHNIFISLFYLSGFCYYSNSASNPILYNIFSGRYRSAFCHTILGERITAKYVASASFVERGVNQRLAGSKIPLIQRAKTERNFGSNTFPPVKSSSFQGVVYSARGKDKRHKNSLTDLTLQCIVTMLLKAIVLFTSLNCLWHICNAVLSETQLRSICPKDPEFCAKKAVQGECYGKSLKSNVLKKKCSCSCDSVIHERIQKCCKTVGPPEMKFCLPLCGYNTTVEALGSSLGVKCVSQLTTWAYCAADANDNTECCKTKGVSSECLSFCKGDVPTCDVQSIFSYQPCLKNIKSIIECQVENLKPEPRWDAEWTAPCDWEE